MRPSMMTVGCLVYAVVVAIIGELAVGIELFASGWTWG